MARFAYSAMALIFAPLAFAPLVFAQETTLEEIVVTSSFTHQVQGQNESSVKVILGDDITQNLSQSLGEHLSTTLGVSSNNFGPAVGQPVIRGMSGNRVKVLQNNMVVRDVAGIGPDHPIDVDLSNVEQIEIVRGAAALLHSNGASGGIINIVDNTIARTDIEEPLVTLSAEQQTGNKGEGFTAGFRQNIAGFNLSYSFRGFDAQDYEIPNGAVLHDEEHDEHDDEGEHDEHDEHEEDMGTLANSDFETKTHRFGLSKTGDWGYVGASYQDLSYTFGIPFHGEHSDHEEGHEGEDHDDDHEGEDHDDDHEGEEGHDEHEDERIVSKTDSEVITLEGQLNLNGALLNSIRFSVRDTNYTLLEQHAEEDHEEGEHEDEHEDEHEGHSEEPTLFTNDSTEVQMVFNLGSAEHPRRLVLNQVTEKVAILGEEAFMEPVKSSETTFGVFAGFERAGFDIDFGARWDDIEREGMIREMHHDDEHEEEHHDDEHEGEEEHDDEHGSFELESFTFKDQSLSGAVTIGRELSDSLNASLNIALVNRTPSAIELFMNGEHLAVARYEVGDANLDMERSNNLDFNLRYDDNTWFANASIYRNNVDNYIYLRDESEEEHEAHEAGDDDHEEEHHEHGDLMLAEYMQNDATFSGYEIEIGRRFNVAGGELEVRLQRDQVKADFARGGSVPRVTPSRNVFAVDYRRGLSRVMLELQDVGSQNSVSSFETPTSGYTLVNARLSHSIDLGDEAVLTISAFGRNLTDEVARSHTSFVKNEVPLAGRNLGVKASVSF